MKDFLIALMFTVLFSCGYWVCFMLVPDYAGHEAAWWDWRMGLLSVLICGMFWQLYCKSKDYEKLIYSIGFALSGSDVIDRAIFGITSFIEFDKVLIPISIFIAIFNHVRNKKIIHS